MIGENLVRLTAFAGSGAGTQDSSAAPAHDRREHGSRFDLSRGQVGKELGGLGLDLQPV